MKTTVSLNRKVIRAVQTSMRIEGCKPTQSVKIKAQAKALMEQRRVQVSVPGKCIYLPGTDIPKNRLGIAEADLLHEIEETLLQQAYQIFIAELQPGTRFDETYFKSLHQRTSAPGPACTTGRVNTAA
jgi:hypothetical protein